MEAVDIWPLKENKKVTEKVTKMRSQHTINKPNTERTLIIESTLLFLSFLSFNVSEIWSNCQPGHILELPKYIIWKTSKRFTTYTLLEGLYLLNTSLLQNLAFYCAASLPLFFVFRIVWFTLEANRTGVKLPVNQDPPPRQTGVNSLAASMNIWLEEAWEHTRTCTHTQSNGLFITRRKWSSSISAFFQMDSWLFHISASEWGNVEN